MNADTLDAEAILRAADHPAPQPTFDGPVARAPARPAPDPHSGRSPATPSLARLLRLRVPVVVRLAQRTMPISAIRDLAVSAVIEFVKAVDEPLELLINNHPIGRGVCVKVGENFGLKLTEICDRRQRVLSLVE